MQRLQNNVLRTIVNAPWYIRNKDLLRNDLNVAMVVDGICCSAQLHAKRLSTHVNNEVVKLIQMQNSQEKVKRLRHFNTDQEYS